MIIRITLATGQTQTHGFDLERDKERVIERYRVVGVESPCVGVRDLKTETIRLVESINRIFYILLKINNEIVLIL